ncbi:MAG: succinate dehydrogenase cytochrome b558 subunit [Candidatus Binatia bacterium]
MAMDADAKHFLLRRLHSLSGIVPIGGFLLFHFFENGKILAGPQAWAEGAEAIQAVPLPILLTLEITVLYVPILFHAFYGLYIVRTGRPNFATYGYQRNYFYTLQRLSGVIAFFFIGFHVASTRIRYYLTGVDADFSEMQSWMANPLVLAVYVVGVLASVFHFANGIWGFSVSWGLTVGPRAQRVLQAACLTLFVGMSVLGLNIILAFRP